MLNTSPNLQNPDDFYEALLDAHQGLTFEASHTLNARLVLILVLQVGRRIEHAQTSNDFHISMSRSAVQMRGSRCAVASS